MAGLTVPDQVFSKIDTYVTGRIPQHRVGEHTKKFHVKVSDISLSRSAFVEDIATFQAKEVLARHYVHRSFPTNPIARMFLATVDFLLWAITVPLFLFIAAISFFATVAYQILKENYWSLPAPVFGTFMFTLMGVIAWRFQRKLRRLS